MCPRNCSPQPGPSLVCTGGGAGAGELSGRGDGLQAKDQPPFLPSTATLSSQEVEDEEEEEEEGAPDYENLQELN